MRWDHCKACNELLTDKDLALDPLQELCKECYSQHKEDEGWLDE
jgi:formylmethanofuran dehydrogenase subunit E